MMAVLQSRKVLFVFSSDRLYKKWAAISVLTALVLLLYLTLIAIDFAMNFQFTPFFSSAFIMFTSLVIYLINRFLFQAFTEVEKVSNSLANANVNMANLYGELDEKNEKLAKAYEELTQTQDQLVESEKMAALGQLVAGIAHEINTPIGAVNAANSNILHVLKDNLLTIISDLREINEESIPLFLDLIEDSMASKEPVTSKEEREQRKKIKERLDELGVEDSYNIADTLVDMHIGTGVEKYMPIFQNKESSKILHTAYLLCDVLSNTVSIENAVDRVKKIVFALKSYVHGHTLQELTKCSVQETIEVVLTLYHNQLKYGIEVITDFQEIPDINIYKDELIQVWTNIVHNAIQAMNAKGVFKVNLYEDNDFVVVEMIDNGPGIAEEVKDSLFSPFVSTKKSGEGSGLGLNIVQKIIEKHNGEISAYSESGETVFKVLLPKNLTA